MKAIGIDKPCSENWNAMTPTEQGKFCQKCATQVYDFTNKSNIEIKQTLRSLIGQPICGRITPAQEDSLNAEFIAWSMQSHRSFQSRMLFSLVVVFGLTLFSCTHEQDQDKISALQAKALHVMKDQSVGVFQQENLIAESLTKTGDLMFIEPMVIGYSIRQDVSRTVEELELVEIRGEEYYHGSYGGAMIMMDRYEDYLLQDGHYELVQELDENGQPYPTSFESIVFPNPTSAATTFELKIPVKNIFEIGLYDMNGKFIQPIHSGELDRGTFRHQLDLTSLNTGIYLVVINSNDFKKTVRISKV